LLFISGSVARSEGHRGHSRMGGGWKIAPSSVSSDHGQVHGLYSIVVVVDEFLWLRLLAWWMTLPLDNVAGSLLICTYL